MHYPNDIVCVACPASMACIAGAVEYYARPSNTLVVLKDTNSGLTHAIINGLSVPRSYVLGLGDNTGSLFSNESWLVSKDCPALKRRLEKLEKLREARE